jgi:DNA-3-methyladenine glycosylase II
LLETSRRFWEGFTPAALAGQPGGPGLHTVFCAEGDWRRAEAEVTQAGDTAHLVVTGDGDLEAAAAQACRFLALDVDARGWPQVGRRDPVIGDAQARLPGLRPCGFHSPYEAAAWAVLAQRVRIVQAARLRAELIAGHGEDGAFPSPRVLRRLDLDLPGRKSEYLRAVAEAALDGLLDGAALRALDPEQAAEWVQHVKGSARSLPNWSWYAGRMSPTRCPGMSRGWTPRSPSGMVPASHSPKSRRRGGPTAPGPLCTYVRCATAHQRDRPPLSHQARPDTLSGHAHESLSCANRRYARQADLRPDFVYGDRPGKSARRPGCRADVRLCRIAGVAQVHTHAHFGIFPRGLMATMIAELVCVVSL